jgi:3-dehydroquinate dehydratase type I
VTTSQPFPLRGVIGVVANDAAELNEAIDKKLQCVEIRADLLLDCGLSLDDVLALIKRATDAGIATLLTLRHPSHGGMFAGSEQERAAINRQALQAGADIIDLEWQSEAATTMLAEGAPLILSHHDFNHMPDDAELARITAGMLQAGSAAIKLVPTAATTNDAIRMLRWVADADDSTRRIGFAMGAAGAPITYTSFGPAVAPGQIALDKLLSEYRVQQMSQQTTIVAMNAEHPDAISALNQTYAQSGEDRVAVGFSADAANLLQREQQLLNISEMRFD